MAESRILNSGFLHTSLVKLDFTVAKIITILPTNLDIIPAIFATVTWIHSEAMSRNMRQLNIRQCAVRESVHHKEIVPVHIPVAINPSDLFTKEMRDKTHFLHLRSALMSAGPEDVDAVQGGVDLT